VRIFGDESPPAGQRVFVAGITGHQLIGGQYLGGSEVIEIWNLPDDKNKVKPALAAGEVDVLTISK
jgi:hypothetical protein